MGEGVPYETADAWLDEWVRRAYRDPPTRPDGGFWDDGWEWIAANRSFPPHPSSWDHRMPEPDNDRVWTGAVLWICVVALTALLGVVLLVVFLAIDLPAWLPILGTLVGVLGGFFLGVAIQHGLLRVLDLARVSSR